LRRAPRSSRESRASEQERCLKWWRIAGATSLVDARAWRLAAACSASVVSSLDAAATATS
jgi:hypothetical protein